MYTPEMELAVRSAAPLDLAKAKVLATELDVSYRSIIAKAKQLKVEYIPQPAPAKQPTKVTKADKVAALEFRFDVKLAGLEKAPASALDALLTVDYALTVDLAD